MNHSPTRLREWDFIVKKERVFEMIGIIDYKMGNLRSVQKAFEEVGAQAEILNKPDDIVGVDHLVLPGVGAFGDGVDHLQKQGWVQPMKEFIDSGKPFLGICLGLQMLFGGSQEDAQGDVLVKGLEILDGEVLRFRVDDGPIEDRLKVPHMGWNTITWQREDPLFAGLQQDAAVYFVHGFYAKPDDVAGVASAMCDYGQPFCASVWRDNVWATQFHPEKSQKVGLTMLRNFAGF